MLCVCHGFAWSRAYYSSLFHPCDSDIYTLLFIYLFAGAESVPRPPPDFPRFSMAAGNFTELYSTPQNAGAWDAVVTCFFIDTAPVVME
jgi:hypothetical protein